MQKYIKKDTQEIITLVSIKFEHKSVSFPSSGPSKEWLEENGYAVFEESERPEAGTWKVVYRDGYEQVGDVWKDKWSERDMTPDEKEGEKSRLKDHLEYVRWEVEQGGIQISETVHIPTRDRDKILINGKITSCIMQKLPDEDTFDFTLNGQNILMTVAEIKAIGLAIEAHVQKTITVAGVVRGMISDETLTDKDAIEYEYRQRMSA